MNQTIPKVYVTRFFQLVTARQFAEAERVLERLKQKMKMSERNRGYFQALYGMLLAQRSNNDRYVFISILNLNDKKELHGYRREFQRQSERGLHSDYDRGFFSAWADYMKILSKLELPPTPIPNKNNVQMKTEIIGEEPEEKTETEKEPIEKIEKIETETETEVEKAEIAVVEQASSVETSEPRQSTLFDFSK